MKVLACVVCCAAILTVLGASRIVSAAGCCGGDDQQAPAKPEAEVIAQKTCPVMGGAIKKDIFVDYSGRRIYFCCNGCPETFKKDPEKYLKIVDKQLKEAKPEGTAPGAHEGHAH